jgi:hypothetical protein
MLKYLKTFNEMASDKEGILYKISKIEILTGI